MAINSFSALIGLTESARGFNGGSATDYYPELSLDESVGGLTDYLIQWNIDEETDTQRRNAQMVNMMVESVKYGTPIDESSIINEAMSDIVDKVKSFFDGILKWIKSVIAKLRMFVDRITMSGENLVSKYRESVQEKDLDGLKFTGYKFKSGIVDDFDTKLKDIQSDTTLVTAIQKMVGDSTIKSFTDFTTSFCDAGGNNAGNAKPVEAEAMKKKINDVSTEKRVDNLMKDITNLNKSSNWKATLKKYFFGGDDKTELKCSNSGGYGDGTNTFSFNAVADALENPVDLSDIIKKYDDFKDSVEKAKDTIEREVEDFKRKTESARNYSGPDDTMKKKSTALVTASQYATSYLGAISSVYTVIGTIRECKVDALKQKNNQAKAIFGKMMTYKKSSNNNSFTDDDIDDFGIDVLGDIF